MRLMSLVGGQMVQYCPWCERATSGAELDRHGGLCKECRAKAEARNTFSEKELELRMRE
jgi:hypothetical protein